MNINEITEKIIGSAYTVAIDVIHKAQVLNYLKASQKQVGLLINFGTPRVTIERIVNGIEEKNDIKK